MALILTNRLKAEDIINIYVCMLFLTACESDVRHVVTTALTDEEKDNEKNLNFKHLSSAQSSKCLLYFYFLLLRIVNTRISLCVLHSYHQMSLFERVDFQGALSMPESFISDYRRLEHSKYSTKYFKQWDEAKEFPKEAPATCYQCVTDNWGDEEVRGRHCVPFSFSILTNNILKYTETTVIPMESTAENPINSCLFHSSRNNRL